MVRPQRWEWSHRCSIRLLQHVCARAEELHDSTANAKLLQFDRNAAAVPVPEMLQLMPSALHERPLPPASLGLAAGADAPGGGGSTAARPHGALDNIPTC